MEITGKTQDQVRDIARNALEPAIRCRGYDDPSAAIVGNFELFMGSAFRGFPIKADLGILDIWEKTLALRNGMERAFPPSDSGWNQKWEYYRPGLDKVEQACAARDLEKAKEAVDELIDLQLHD